MTRFDLLSTDAAHRVVVHGNLDLAGSGAIRAALLAALTASPRRTLMDLGAVPLLTSAGIRLIVEAAKILRAANTQLVLRTPQEFVASALAIAGLDSLIVIEKAADTRPAASTP